MFERKALKNRFTGVVAFGVALLAAMVVSIGSQRAAATPVFAQAYGVACITCHTQMPMLNAFGRYVQRTGYAALNRKALQHAVPVFLFDIGTGYSHQSGDPSTDKINGPFHTTLLQANSYLSPDVTYKIEQLLVVGGNAGFLEQGWLAYHNFFNHDGHLFLGKIAGIDLDEFGAGVLDEVNIADSAVPNVAVGVHSYGLDYGNGRWGAKFNFVRGKTAVEVAYLGNPTYAGSFADAYDYSRGANKSLQWRVAYADPAKPYEIGVFGENGALGFTGSGLLPGNHVDNYNVVTPYINKDPRPGSPGFRIEYATATDSNPGYKTSAAGGRDRRSDLPGLRRAQWRAGSLDRRQVGDPGRRPDGVLSPVGAGARIELCQVRSYRPPSPRRCGALPAWR